MNSRNMKCKLRFHNRKILLGTVLFACVFLLFVTLMFGITATVSASEQKAYVKQVTCVTVASGDTLWSIAQDHMSPGYSDVTELLDEIRTSNRIYGDTIHAGQHLIVPIFCLASE